MHFRFLSIILLCSFFVTDCSVVYAQFQAAPQFEDSLAFVSFEDGNADEETAELAHDLSLAFSNTQEEHVVKQKIVRDVLAYYPLSTVDVSEDDARNQVKQAKEFYYFGQFQDAEVLLKSFFNQAADKVKEDGALLMEAHLLSALVFKAQHKKNEMALSLQDALKINPFFRIDENLYSPSFRFAFEKERKKIFSGPLGSLEIRSDPELAQVYINDVLQGTTPVSLSAVPSGKYTITLKAQHYKEVEKVIDVFPEQNHRFSPHLQWNYKKEKNPTKLDDKNEALLQFRFSQHASKLLKLTKLVLLDIDVSENAQKAVSAMVYDAKSNVAFTPIVDSNFVSSAVSKSQLSSRVLQLLHQDPLHSSHKSLLAIGDASIEILQKARERKKRKRRKIIWYGVASAAVAGVLGAFASAGSSGSSTDANRTSLELQLKGNGK